PHRIVIDVVIGKRPEQWSDPAISAVAVPPPSGPAAAMPSGYGRTRCDSGAGVGVAERGPVVQRARDRAGVQRVAHGVCPCIRMAVLAEGCCVAISAEPRGTI